jgi:hypothetical protein
MTKILAAFAALSLAACIDQPTTSPVAKPETRQPTTSLTRTVALGEPGANICNSLPADGPCSLACDPAALADQYIKVNTCVDFACTLDDGQTIHIGGCR